MEILLLTKFKSQNIIIVYNGLEMVWKIKSVAISYAGRSKVRIPAGIKAHLFFRTCNSLWGSPNFLFSRNWGFLLGVNGPGV